MGVTIDSVLVRDTSAASADVDGRVVVLSVQTGAYVSFNDVASEIWNLLSEPRRVSEIFDVLAQSHDVDDGALTRDVLPFLQRLIDRKLAHPHHPDAAR